MKTNDQLRTYGVPIVLANALICDSELPCRVLLYDTQSLSNLGVEFVLTIDFMIFFNTEFLPQVVFLAFPCFVLAFGFGEAASLLFFSSLILFVSFLQETAFFVFSLLHYFQGVSSSLLCSSQLLNITAFSIILHIVITLHKIILDL